MKKVFLLLLCVILLAGCNLGKKDVKEDSKVTEMVSKIDNSKDYVYFDDYKTITLNNNEYVYKIGVINIDSSQVETVNLELKNLVLKSYRDSLNGKITLLNYEYFVSNDYVSVIQKYQTFIDGIYGEEKANVYVVSIKEGKLFSNENILGIYNLTENDMFELVKKKSGSDDADLLVMNIKSDGYQLYINDDNKLVIRYDEISNDDSIIKELVLN